MQESPGPRGRAAGDRGCGARRARAETRARRAGALQTAQGAGRPDARRCRAGPCPSPPRFPFPSSASPPAAGGRAAAGTGGDLRPNPGPDPPAAGARGRAERARRGGAVGTGTSGTPRSGCQLKGWTRPRRRRTRQRPPPSGPLPAPRGDTRADANRGPRRRPGSARPGLGT